jgi:hypothetical protein
MSSAPNQVTGNRGPDVIETPAEAFDREVLYIAAAPDMYGRRHPLLIDPTRDPLKFRQSRRVGRDHAGRCRRAVRRDRVVLAV